MSKDTNSRYIWLLRTLLEKGGLTYEQIRDRWECSSLNDDHSSFPKRTFHQHKSAVERMFQVSIKSDASDDYRYYVEDADEVSRENLTRWLIDSASVSSALDDCKDIKDRILLEQIACGAEFLPEIVGAIRAHQALDVEYQSFNMSQPETYTMYPYSLKNHNHRWYMLGLDKKNDRVIHLSLDRMKNVRNTGKSFNLPKNFNPAEYYANCIGIEIMPDDKPEKVVLRVLGKMVNYLHTTPLHHSQNVINETDDYTDYEYWLVVNNELVRKLLSLENSVKVLQPKSLKAKMVNEALKILNMYYNSEEENSQSTNSCDFQS